MPEHTARILAPEIVRQVVELVFGGVELCGDQVFSLDLGFQIEGKASIDLYRLVKGVLGADFLEAVRDARLPDGYVGEPDVERMVFVDVSGKRLRPASSIPDAGNHDPVGTGGQVQFRNEPAVTVNGHFLAIDAHRRAGREFLPVHAHAASPDRNRLLRQVRPAPDGLGFARLLRTPCIDDAHQARMRTVFTAAFAGGTQNVGQPFATLEGQAFVEEFEGVPVLQPGGGQRRQGPDEVGVGFAIDLQPVFVHPGRIVGVGGELHGSLHFSRAVDRDLVQRQYIELRAVGQGILGQPEAPAAGMFGGRHLHRCDGDDACPDRFRNPPVNQFDVCAAIERASGDGAVVRDGLGRPFRLDQDAFGVQLESAGQIGRNALGARPRERLVVFLVGNGATHRLPIGVPYNLDADDFVSFQGRERAFEGGDLVVCQSGRPGREAGGFQPPRGFCVAHLGCRFGACRRLVEDALFLL